MTTIDSAPFDLTALDELYEPIMRRAVAVIGESVPRLEHMAAYHMGWRNADLTPIDGQRPHPGKRMRPRLVMLVAGALGTDPGLAAPVAAAIELLHNFTLVHDDIQDQSHLRRHRPTVWSLWGTAQAINAGDALFACSHLALYELALEPATAHMLPKLATAFDRTTLAIVGGQTLDIDNEGDPTVTPDRYLQTITGKTSAIVEFAAWAGGVVASAGDEALALLARFGLSTGLAFQIRDDALGIWGDEAATGKTHADDIRRRKQTLPIIRLIAVADASDRDEIRSIYQADTPSEGEVQQVLSLLDRYEIQQAMEREIEHYHDRAAMSLAALVDRDANESARALYRMLDAMKFRSS